MSWFGKLMGGAFGFMLGGPLGALLGAALGHKFDRGVAGMAGGGQWAAGDTERVQSAFFTATFSVMGYIAKADGRVTADEINVARQVMSQMNLSPEMMRAAKELFNQGKAPDFPLDAILEQFRRECSRRRNLLLMFLEIQLHAAYADGQMHSREREALRHICERLGFPATEFERLEQMVRAARGFSGGGTGSRSRADDLEAAYELLGVSAEATDPMVKKAYRRLMSQHHPDKLVSKGLPEEMIKLATERTVEIRAAYEMIRKTRKSG